MTQVKRAVFVKKKLYENAKENIEKMTEQDDLVWIHFRRHRFPEQCKCKLNSREDGPLKMFAKINDNAYNIDLPKDYDVSPALKCL
jgi:hypothetical protein